MLCIWELCIGNTVKYTLMSHCLIPAPPGSHFAQAFPLAAECFDSEDKGLISAGPELVSL